MTYANTNPIEFNKYIEDYKYEVNNLIEIGKSHEIFDTTKNGVINFGADGAVKKVTLLDGIPSEFKGELMLQYVYENCLEPKVVTAINKLKDFIKENIK